MLCGRTNHSMDAKNRIIIPQTFRQEIGENVYVTVGYDHNLFIMSSETFEALAKKVLDVPETSVESREFRRTFFGNASMCQLDKTGRLILPQILIDHAKIEKDVVIIGVFDKLEVWAKEAYDEYLASASVNSMDAVLEKMASHGV
ncbi:MAG: division/cell wall cluster transcriptional repressor MraZ [Clostridia bacterium]|nr:division/cell wall cluster transcriptional repressor MraZ [Clostridia bacterium]